MSAQKRRNSRDDEPVKLLWAVDDAKRELTVSIDKVEQLLSKMPSVTSPSAYELFEQEVVRWHRLVSELLEQMFSSKAIAWEFASQGGEARFVTVEPSYREKLSDLSRELPAKRSFLLSVVERLRVWALAARADATAATEYAGEKMVKGRQRCPNCNTDNFVGSFPPGSCMVCEHCGQEFEILYQAVAAKAVAPAPLPPRSSIVEYDAFISHASEDKEAFVRPFASELAKEMRVWYDEFSLKLGDRLSESIDRGLRSSRYGVVVLSHAFFAKRWPAAELSALVTRANNSGKPVIIPIWHGVNRQDVESYSPLLADLVAVTSTADVPAVARAIIARVREK